MEHVMVFVLMFVAEAMSTAWTRIVVHGKPHQSATISAMIVPWSVFATVLVVESAQRKVDIAVMMVAAWVSHYATRKVLEKLKK